MKMKPDNDLIDFKKQLQKAAQFFGRMTFTPDDPDAIKTAERISKQEIEENYSDILDSLITCMQVLRGYGEANPHLRDEIIEGLEIVLQDLRAADST